MRFILFVLSVLSFLAGGLLFVFVAQSAIHEIEAFMLFLIAAVLLAGSSIVEAINVARKSIEAQLRELLPKPPAPPSTSEHLAEVLFEEARLRSESGAKDEAVGLLRTLIRKYPDSSLAAKARRSLERNGIQ